MPAGQPTSRRRLLEYLEGVLTGIEEGDPTHEGKALAPILYEAIDGLKALDAGEVRPIFERTKTRRHGKAFTREYLERRAVGYVSALIERGQKASVAESAVGGAYKIERDRLQGWRKKYKKRQKEQPDILAPEWIVVSEDRLFRNWYPEKLVRALAQDGKAFRNPGLHKKTGKN